MNLQVFNYNGSDITFLSGKNVMVNATQMAKPFGKRTNDFLSAKSTQELINSLSVKTGISATDLVAVSHGGSNQGTWMHEDLALVFAQWLSPDFYLWCNDRIKELLQVGITATPATLEEMINNPELVIGLATKVKELRAANRQHERTIAKLKPKADFADTAFNADTLVTMSQAAKILKLDFGRNTLFKKLREHGILFRHSNEPAQKYVNAGYFTVVEGAPIQRSDGRTFIPITTYCTQKGLAFLHKLFGGDGFALKLR